MADAQNKDADDLMAALAQMEEKAKNWETLAAVRGQVVCKTPGKIRHPTQNPRQGNK